MPDTDPMAPFGLEKQGTAEGRQRGTGRDGQAGSARGRQERSEESCLTSSSPAAMERSGTAVRWSVLLCAVFSTYFLFNGFENLQNQSRVK